MVTVETAWVFSQSSSLLLSLLVLVGLHVQYLYASAYFSIVVSMALSLYQALVLQQKKTNNNPNEKESTIPEKQPLGDLKSYIAEAKRLYLVARPQLKPILTNQSTPYLIVAIFQWIWLKKMVLTLVPFTFYSFFHVLTHVKNYVLPSVTKISTQRKEMLKSVLNNFNTKWGPKCILFATYSEIASFLAYTGSAITGTLLILIGRGNGFIVSWLAVLVWFVFLNVRYDESLAMKKAVHALVSSADGFIADPRVPVQLRTIWRQLKYATTVFFQRVKFNTN